MDSLEAWFNGMHILVRGIVALVLLPVVLLLAGIAIIILEPPGDGFWRDKKPSWWRGLLVTTSTGFVGTMLLGAIFGVSLVFKAALRFFGAGSWAGAASFALALILVLGAVAYWFELRHSPVRRRRDG